MSSKIKIPKPVKEIADALTAAGYEAYLVGGCLRDLLMSREPKDWDIATNAKPPEIQKIFPESVYENSFGTVAVKTETADPTMKIVEVTTYRLEGKYTDKRHPDEIKFAKTIDEDLSRRDFTINAMAYEISKSKGIVDPFSGQEDLKNKIIRAVGEPRERFSEDALRLMRAVRFAAQLGFTIEEKTAKAIKEKAGLLEFIAKERVQDELRKLLMTEGAAEGIRHTLETDLLKQVLPELAEGVAMEQNKHHKYSVFEHNVKALEYAAQKGYSFIVRLASLLHDVGKPRVRAWKDDPRGEKTHNGRRGDWTFYQHQYVGEKMALKMLDRLRFSKETTAKIALLVREHMFVYDPEVVTERGVRRLVHRVGGDNIDELLQVREADRIGSGVPKAQPYRLRHLQAMIEKAKQEPLSPKQLKARGDDVMELTGIDPKSPEAPRIGKILAVLLEEVVDDPAKNDRELLRGRIKELAGLSVKELDKLSAKAKESVAEVQERIDAEIKKKYFVK